MKVKEPKKKVNTDILTLAEEDDTIVQDSVQARLTTLYGNLGFEFEVIPSDTRYKLIAKHLGKPQWETIFDPNNLQEMFDVVNEYGTMTLYRIMSNARCQK